MAVQKRAEGRYEVYVYVPKARRKPGEDAKRYVGTRAKKREADQLFEDAKRELRGKPPVSEMQVKEYAARWLEFKHGPETRRPRPGTLRTNRQMLVGFLKDYGDHALTGIPRNEALDWSLKHRAPAKAVAAMFNDAINDELIKSNPFANRQQKQARGRKDITPLTEEEVELLASLAVEIWGEPYGSTCRAWILFSAWVGTRPGETFGLTWDDIDLANGFVTVKRVKPPYNTDVIPLAQRVQQALLELPYRSGLLFATVTGKRIVKGSSRYYWDPVRKAFETKIKPERKAQLLNGRPDLDLYELRHFIASQIVKRGGNEYDVAAMLGNTPEVARETYIHEYRDDRNARLRSMLDSGSVSPLDAKRKLRGA